MPLDDSERALCTAIERRRDALLDDLRRHVAIPTGFNHRPGLDAYRELLVARLRRLGAEVEVRPAEARPAWLDAPGAGGRHAAAGAPAPIAVIRRRASGPRALIAGHLDTVHDPDGDFRELALSDDGAVATGPGAADMKGGIVIAVTALEALGDAGVPLDWTVVLNSDEEQGSLGSAAVLREVAAACDVGLAVEPALPGGALAVRRMGSGQFRLDVLGRAAHVGREFSLGVSAVTKLAELIQAVAALADPDAGRIVNVGPLLGGSAVNVVPDRAAAWGNVRFADAAAGEALGEALDALATSEDALPRVVVHRVFNRPAKPLTDGVRALAEAARGAAADLGQELPFTATGGVCDGNILQDAGLPTIDTLGVLGGNLHRTDEFIEVPSLVTRAQLLAVLLSRVATGRAAVAGTAPQTA